MIFRPGFPGGKFFTACLPVSSGWGECSSKIVHKKAAAGVPAAADEYDGYSGLTVILQVPVENDSCTSTAEILSGGESHHVFGCAGDEA